MHKWYWKIFICFAYWVRCCHRCMLSHRWCFCRDRVFFSFCVSLACFSSQNTHTYTRCDLKQRWQNKANQNVKTICTLFASCTLFFCVWILLFVVFFFFCIHLCVCIVAVVLAIFINVFGFPFFHTRKYRVCALWLCKKWQTNWRQTLQWINNSTYSWCDRSWSSNWCVRCACVRVCVCIYLKCIWVCIPNTWCNWIFCVNVAILWCYYWLN